MHAKTWMRKMPWLVLLALCGCREMFVPPNNWEPEPHGPPLWCSLRLLSIDGQPPRRFERGYLVRSGQDSTLRFGVSATRIYLPPDGEVVESIDYDEMRWFFSEKPFVSGFFHCHSGKRYAYGRTGDYGFGDPRRGRFFSTSSGTRELSFNSSDDNVFAVRRSSDIEDEIVFKRPGQASLIVMLEDSEVARVPIELVPSPVSLGMTNSELVKKLGFPSSEEKQFVQWPKSGSLNREVVSPTAEEGTVRIVHVRFDAYPELVVSLDDAGAVKGWHSLSPL